MITASESAFPNCAINVLKDFLEAIDPDVPVYKRPLRLGDPIQAFAIVPSTWMPDESTWEIGRRHDLSGPTVTRYMIAIQCYNQDMDQERGASVSSRMSGIVRNMLSRDVDIRVALGRLTNREYGFVERFTRGYVQAQRFLTNEVDGSFLHLSNLEFIVETEITNE